jgi:hypothetical protein
LTSSRTSRELFDIGEHFTASTEPEMVFLMLAEREIFFSFGSP